MLITDYSSVIYEYTLLDRPMLFYAYDKDTYSAARGFHRDYDAAAPGKVCETFDELVKSICRTRTSTFGQGRGVPAGRTSTTSTPNSADRVIDWLILGDHGNETGGFQPWLAPVPDDTAVGDQPLSDQSEE